VLSNGIAKRTIHLAPVLSVWDEGKRNSGSKQGFNQKSPCAAVRKSMTVGPRSLFQDYATVHISAEAEEVASGCNQQREI
jgi:hypothetical protein